jgi:hypothetical protein
MNTATMIKKLDVMKLWKDPAFYVALVTALLHIVPEVGEWEKQNREALIPLYIVLAGHFGVRYKAAGAKGKVMEQAQFAEAVR